MGDNGDDAMYACKCLNVRLHCLPADTTPPHPVEADLEFRPIHVGEEGIFIAHPQLTLRASSRGIPLTGSTRCTRYMSLICLICQVLVYRIYQAVSLEEGKEEHISSEEWVEQQILKSPSGWIEVHSDCLNGKAILETQRSTSYSKGFAVVIPSPQSFPPSPERESRIAFISPTASQPSTPTTPQVFTANLKQIFPPPPFTSSHPVFVHLSSLALQQSQELRTEADKFIRQIIEHKTAEIERKEDELRQEVEALWKTYRRVSKVEREKRNKLSASDNSRPLSILPSRVTPLAIRDFVPMASPPTRSTLHSPPPRQSSLSESLLTSNFHHPKAKLMDSRMLEDVIDESGESTITSTNGVSSSSPSSNGSKFLFNSSNPTTTRVNPGAGNITEPFRRNMDQSTDTATSFRYFTILEADRSRAKGANTKEESRPLITRSTAETTRLAARAEGAIEDKPVEKDSRVQTVNDAVSGTLPKNKDTSPKGKRKVTFNIQPAVVAIKGDTAVEKSEEEVEESDESTEMIFDLEDEGGERSVNDATAPVLPLLEIATPVRHPKRTAKKSKKSGVAESLSSLRPASLPMPSQMRPPRSPNGADTSAPTMQIAKVLGKPPREVKAQPEKLDLTPDPREAEILELVAANTPSHRGAWRRDSKAWQSLVHRYDENSDSSMTSIWEGENEEFADNSVIHGETNELAAIDESNEAKPPAFVGSLPVQIATKQTKGPTLSLASYQPQTATPELNEKSTNQPVAPSSAAFRRAAYAERDRHRSRDPGALDFLVEEESSSMNEGGESEPGDAAGERGRKMALKILQAGTTSDLPEAGLWRSYA